MITRKEIGRLPNTIGIYIFKKDEAINYIGKSVNIKARVSSHLENSKLDNKERLIINNSDTIKVITTESEFKALILEAKLIREFQPKYNSIWKDDKSPLYIKLTMKEKYPKVFLTRKPSSAEATEGKKTDKQNLYFGPFSSTRTAVTIISDIRKIIPFCTQKKVTSRACFYSKIGLCNPCPNEIQSQDMQKQYRKNINQVASILKGNITNIVKSFYQQLKIFTKNKQYEKAIIIRNKILRFNKLLQLKVDGEEFLINKNNNSLTIMLIELKKYFPLLNKLERIETYDISNLALKQAVGSMVVMKNSQIDKNEYRRFKIKKIGLRSDIGRLGEVIERRLKQSWPTPDLIIIDGGRLQLKTVRTIFEKNRTNIPLLGIVKNPDRVIIGIDGYPNMFLKNNSPILNVVRLLRDESHRFARKYHLFLRSKDFLI